MDFCSCAKRTQFDKNQQFGIVHVHFHFGGSLSLMNKMFKQFCTIKVSTISANAVLGHID